MLKCASLCYHLIISGQLKNLFPCSDSEHPRRPHLTRPVTVYILNTLQIDRKHDTFILFCLEANIYIFSPFLVFFCFLGVFLLAKLKLLFLESKINVKRLLQTLCTYLLLFIYLSHKFVCYQYLFLSPSVFILVKLLVKKADKLKLLTLLRV